MSIIDKFYFYSKSKDVKPGNGVNEIVFDIGIYDELSKIKDWRKILSNFHVYPFEYNGYTYNTIEHAFQAKKIELVDKEKSLWFTIESENEIGKGNGEIARKNRKLVKLNKDMLEKWSTIRDNILEDISIQKYKQCDIAKNVLKLTKNAELWHIVSRSKPIRFEHLERIRKNN